MKHFVVVKAICILGFLLSCLNPQGERPISNPKDEYFAATDSMIVFFEKEHSQNKRLLNPDSLSLIYSLNKEHYQELYHKTLGLIESDSILIDLSESKRIKVRSLFTSDLKEININSFPIDQQKEIHALIVLMEKTAIISSHYDTKKHSLFFRTSINKLNPIFIYFGEETDMVYTETEGMLSIQNLCKQEIGPFGNWAYKLAPGIFYYQLQNNI